MRAARFALSISLLSCGELPRPSWVLADAPRVLAIRVDVAEDGPLAEGLGPVPPGRLRAEVLPGDVVQPRALVVTADGELDLDATGAAWFLCTLDCPFRWEGEPPSCDDVEPWDVPICLAGRGAAPRLVVPGTIESPTATLGVWPTIAVVSGMESPADTDRCIDRLQSRIDEPFQDCAIGARQISYGPEWRLFEEYLAQLDDDVPEFELPVPIDIARLLPPNAAPELSRVWISPDARSYDLSEPISVPAGKLISIGADPDPSDRQLYFDVVRGVPNAYQGRFEDIHLVYFTTEEVGVPEGAFIPTPVVDLFLPRDPTSMTLWLVVTDLRGGRSWSRVELEVVAP